MHGDFDIVFDNNIIKITVEGEFNDIAAKAIASELKQLILSLNNTPFAILADLLAFDGGTPEVFAESSEFNAWLNSKNMVAKALVFTSPILIAIEKSLVKSKADQNIKYFADKEKALIWLETQLCT